MKVGEIGEALQQGMKKTTVEVKEHIPTEENLILTPKKKKKKRTLDCRFCLLQ